GQRCRNGHFGRWVGSALLLLRLSAFADFSRTGVSAPHVLVCASGFLGCGLRGAFFGAEVLGQVIQKRAAIGVGDDGAQAFHLVEFDGPSLTSQVFSVMRPALWQLV